MRACTCVCFVGTWLWMFPLLLAIRRGSYNQSLGFRERHTLYKYTPLKGLWGTRYTHPELTHRKTLTRRAAVPQLPIKPSNGCLCFCLIGTASKLYAPKFTKVKKQKVWAEHKIHSTSPEPLLLLTLTISYCSHVCLWLPKWIKFVIHSRRLGGEGGIFTVQRLFIFLCYFLQ